jgi:hypothetical protein
MLSQPKSAMHQQPAKLSWQIISGASPCFSDSVAFFMQEKRVFFLNKGWSP